MPGKPGVALASMGIYVFDTQPSCSTSWNATRTPNAPATTSARTSSRTSYRAIACSRTASAESCVGMEPGAKPYWRDVGTIDAYWEANIELTKVDAGAQHLRSGVADLDLPGAAAAREVRVRRRGTTRRGGRLAGVRRLHRQRLATVRAHCSTPNVRVQQLLGDRRHRRAARRRDRRHAVRKRCVVDKGCDPAGRRHRRSASTRNPTAEALPRHRPRRHADHARHAGPAHPPVALITPTAERMDLVLMWHMHQPDYPA
jgi:hypothetical protein